MIRVEVIETFTLAEYSKLKNIKRCSREEYGKLFVGDTFECDKSMVEYLTKTNKLKKAFVRVIEIIPEETEKPKKTTAKKKK